MQKQKYIYWIRTIFKLATGEPAFAEGNKYGSPTWGRLTTKRNLQLKSERDHTVLVSRPLIAVLKVRIWILTALKRVNQVHHPDKRRMMVRLIGQPAPGPSPPPSGINLPYSLTHTQKIT